MNLKGILKTTRVALGALVVVFAGAAHAQIPVTDVAHISTSIANQVDRMAHMAEESSAAAGLSAEAAKQLDQLAADMQRIVSRYKL